MAQEQLVLSAVGSPDTWTLTAGSTKVVACQTPDDDATTYITSPTTSNSEQMFTLADPVDIGSGDTINYVQLRIRHRRVGTPSGNIQGILRISSNSSYGTDTSTGVGFVNTTDQFTSKPGGGSWTLTDLNNLTAGVRNTLARAVQCTTIEVIVDYTVTPDEASVSDSVSVTDTPVVEVEEIGAPLSVNKSDEVSVTENALGKTSDLEVSVNDGIGISEYSYGNTSDADVPPNYEYALVYDTPTFYPDDIIVSEYASVYIEEGSLDLDINVNDQIGIDEFTDTIVSVPSIDKTETITVDENVDITVSDLYIDRTETVTVDEYAEVYLETAGEINVDVFDEINLDEYVAAYWLLRLYRSQGIIVTDQPNVELGAIGDFNVAVSDDIAVDESVNADISDPQINVSDTIYPADYAYAEFGNLEIYTSDSVAAGENVSVTVSDPVVAVYENVSVDESVNVVLPEIGAVTIVMDDSVSISDNAVITVSSPFITVFDTIDVGEYVDLSIETPVGDTLEIWIDPANIWKQGVKIWP